MEFLGYHATGYEWIAVLYEPPGLAFLADYYLTHGLSAANTKWPYLPFPYNTFIYSGYYDGDGDTSYSPLPFKVNAFTGQIGLIRERNFNGTWLDTAGYTSNWAPTMQLFLDLQTLGVGDTSNYRTGFDKLLTQVRAIIDKVHSRFANTKWAKYGVTVTNEQSVYMTPGNSHSARQAADELLYTSLSGDSSFYTNAVRESYYFLDVGSATGRLCRTFEEIHLSELRRR